MPESTTVQKTRVSSLTTAKGLVGEFAESEHSVPLDSASTGMADAPVVAGVAAGVQRVELDLERRILLTVAPRVGGDHDGRISTLKIGIRLPWGKNGFEIAITFPAEGDSAVVELTYDDIEWAYVELRDIDLTAEGEARVARSRVVVDLWPMVDTEPHARLWRRVLRRRDAQTPSPDPAPKRFECAFEDVEARLEETRAWWSFNPADAIPHLDRARYVLLENERGRVPLEDEHGLTLIGAAWSKMSPENQAAMDTESDGDFEEGTEHSRDD